MTDSFPGPRPVHGDSVRLVTDATSLTVTGAIVSQGVLRDGRNYLALTLPDADPQQRRALAGTTSYQYKLYRHGGLLYSSPYLTLRDTRRTGDGSLVVSGSP
ncbi:hypothetical protein PUR49_07910 [Streptomyces sp. BE147]|uniref:hypothetical protein n=1 Tax=Streptomyces sp. BE147 TaxID=3002524 RepID=UPI002E764D6A|nr:hypothetical protein [Streptomyces sp. BE147]MEE1736423.1 hypothetical protein [Streptomyces sp. BE147]